MGTADDGKNFLVGRDLARDEQAIVDLVHRANDMRAAYRPAAALAILDKAPESLAQAPDAMVARGRVLLALYRHAEACDALLSARASDPGSAVAAAWLIAALSRSRNYREANALSTEACARFDDPIVYLAAGRVLVDQYRFADSLTLFRRASNLDGNGDENRSLRWLLHGLRKARRYGELDELIALSKPAGRVRVEFAKSLADRYDFDAALREFEAVVAVGGRTWVSATVGRLEVLRALNRHDDALLAAKEAIDRAVHVPQLHVGLGLVLDDRYDYEGALAAFAAALDIDPHHADALEWRITALRRLRRWDEAEAAAQEALTRRPDSVGLHVELGYLREDRYDYEGALAAFAAALDIDPHHEWALARRTSTLRQLRRWDEAEAAAQEALTRLPDSLPQRRELAALLEETGDKQTALDTLQVVLDKDPRNETALVGHIRLLRRLRRTQEALMAGRRAIALRPDSTDILVELACVRSSDYDDDQALALLDQALKLDPGHIDAIANKILTLRRMRLLDAAEQYACAAIDVRPSDETLQIYLGHVYEDQLRTQDDALACYDAAVRLNPHSLVALASRASALRTLRLYAEAERVVAPLLCARPYLPTLAVELAWIHHDAGRLVEARMAFSRLRRQARSSEETAESIAGLGWVSFAEGEFATAEEHFSDAVRLAGHRRDYRLAQAWALVRQDDVGQRRRAEQISLALVDEHEDAAVLVCLGVINYRLGRIAAAEHYLTRALKIDPFKGSHTDLAALYTQIGRYDEAEEHLSTALQQDPSNIFARIELGHLKLVTEQPQEAARQFRSVPRTDPSAEPATLGLAEALTALGRRREAEDVLRAHLRTAGRSWRVHVALARLLFHQADTAQNNDLFAEAYQQAIEAIKTVPPGEPDPQYVAAVCQVRLAVTVAGSLAGHGARRRSVRHLRQCLAADERHVEAQRVIHLLETESRSARTIAVGTAVVATVAISLLTVLWTAFFLSNRISELMIMTITPILLGLIAIAVLLPSLIRLKMPGFEADLQARASQATSGPTGDVVIRSGDLVITTGPAGYTLSRHGIEETRGLPR